jgi:ketosteroid isomerase-like protein
MATPTDRMKELLASYFKAWQERDAELIASLFTLEGIYRVKPFGIEEYHGQSEIKQYWLANAGNARRGQPNPTMQDVAFGENFCFLEWQNKFVSSNGTPVTTQGMMLLRFEDGRISELKEHFMTIADSDIRK